MFKFKFNDNKYNHIHFIGIGGVSMSGLAEILIDKGYYVSGTDKNKSDIVNRLEELGADIFIGHNKNNIKNSDLVIYTDAISSDNEELIEAKKSNIPTVDRATFLGAIMQNYNDSIAVSGTHGKTTTTSMIASITNHSEDFNPTILLGGLLDDIGGNIRIDSDNCIITEACEYKANILKYFPTTAIILNIDEDHLDYFKNIDHIVDTFKKYVENIQEGGNLIINIDDPHSKSIINNCKENIITFGIKNNADYMAKNIEFTADKTYFTLVHNNNEWDVVLNVIGIHNIYNAIASMIAVHIHGVSMEDIIDYIKLYTGVHRRLELKGIKNNITVMDDYAHHPTEIKTTLDAIYKNGKDKGTTYCIFQPHTYTRTQILLDSFSESFNNVDQVIITDIFAAREKNNGVIHSKDLVNAVNNKTDNAKYIGEFSDVEDYLNKTIEEGDTIITMGAGNVYLIGESLLENGLNNIEKEKSAI